jgi:hypothetical protein
MSLAGSKCSDRTPGDRDGSVQELARKTRKKYDSITEMFMASTLGSILQQPPVIK